MLTPTHRLKAQIEERRAIAAAQRGRTTTQYANLRHCWHRTLGRPRNLALGFGAGFTYGALRRTQVKVPGRVDLWRLARPVLVSTAMAWWTGRHT